MNILDLPGISHFGIFFTLASFFVDCFSEESNFILFITGLGLSLFALKFLWIEYEFLPTYLVIFTGLSALWLYRLSCIY